jgi:hypothetical protein
LTDIVPFQKIPRWDGTQHIVITEKIDGTNAQIVINEDCTELKCGSRSRWITPEDDNFGFANWAYKHKDLLLGLGKGTHFGEWWGLGIQRCYNVHKRTFSLFNSLRWSTPEQTERLASTPDVSVVPVLYQGPFSESAIEDTMERLWKNGSAVAPGFMNPEGVVIYMPGSRTLFKKTFGDNLPKYLEKKNEAI